jgi:importin-5
MPLLLNMLRHANGVNYGKLSMKAIECAGLISACHFRPRADTLRLVELLM